MTREPVRAETPNNELPFPWSERALIAGWKLLYFKAGELKPDPTLSAELNRGAYLVEGLAHCGACHTPRNRLGAEANDRYLDGGEIDGWHAPALNAASPAPVPWTSEQLFRYLRNGFVPPHGVAAGPMQPVANNLGTVSEQDVKAIATYIGAMLGPIQDDWRLSDRVTINGGVRYTLNFPSTEENNQAAVFNLQTQQLEYLGRDGQPRAARQLHKLNFGPRLGIVGRVTDKTVVRAGYGMVWIEMAGITTPFTTPVFPFLQTVSQRTLDNIMPAFTLATRTAASSRFR